MFSLLFVCDRYADGAVRLRNPHIELMDQDILYHLALGSESHDLHHMFGDVKVNSYCFHLYNAEVLRSQIQRKLKYCAQLLIQTRPAFMRF